MAGRTLKRPQYPMPDDVQKALKKNKLEEAYNQRPPYQQNDYIGWITRSKLAVTREKRLKQMLMELKKGGIYMKMNWRGTK